jgi:hypothetical protein
MDICHRHPTPFWKLLGQDQIFDWFFFSGRRSDEQGLPEGFHLCDQRIPPLANLCADTNVCMSTSRRMASRGSAVDGALFLGPMNRSRSQGSDRQRIDGPDSLGNSELP